MKFRTILIADDDTFLVKVLEKAFIEKDFKVYTANNGGDALKQFYDFKPKIILIDIDMPEKNGWEVLKQIRHDNRLIPILIMTGKYLEEVDAIKSFNDGATLFIRKTHSYKEIIASVESLFKLTYSIEEIFSFGKFTLNMSLPSLFTNNEEYPLTVREAQLLSLLIKNIGQSVETKSILNSVWGNDNSSNYQMLRNAIVKLGKLFEKSGEIHIKSIYGKGYSLQFSEEQK